VKEVEDPVELVAGLAREKDLMTDPRWEALAAGTISASDRAELAALAERSEAARLAFEAFQPSDEKLSDDAAEGYAQKLARGVPEKAPSPANVVPLRRSRRGPALLAAACLAAAAGVSIFVRRQPDLAPIAEYEITPSGGEVDNRSSPSSAGPSVRLGPRSRLVLTLKPRVDVAGDVDVTAALVREGEVRRWDPPTKEISKGSGAVRLIAPWDAAFKGVPPGGWDLVVAVGRPEALPRAEDLAAVKSPPEAGKRPFQILHQRITLYEGEEDARPPQAAIEFSGCAAVWRGPVCKIAGDAKLRFLVRSSPGAAKDPSIAASVDGKPTGAKIDGLRGGWWKIAVDVKSSAREVAIAVVEEGIRRELRLPLAPHEVEPGLQKAESLRWDDKLDEARAAVEPLLGDARPVIRAEAKGKLARIELMASRYEGAFDLFREAIRLDHEAGLVSGEVNDRIALAHTLSFQFHRFEEARSVLDGVGPLEAEDPEARLLAAYDRGQEPFETGDLRSALALFTECAEGAERFEREDLRISALQLRADVLFHLGHAREARDLYRTLQEDSERWTNRCTEAVTLNDFGWFALRAGESVEGASLGLPDPIPLFEKALSRYREACPAPASLSNVLTNLSLAEIDRGHTADARRRLEEARAAFPRAGARLRVYWDLVEARAALADGHAKDALGWFDRMAGVARIDQIRDASLEAAVGRAEALAALGRAADARAAFADADTLLEEHSALVPVWEGKEAFFAWRERSTRSRIDFLLRYAEAQPAGSQEAVSALKEAAAAARRSRGRVLVASQAADRLAALPPEKRAHWQAAMDRYQSRRGELNEKAGSDWQLSKEALDRATEERAAAQRELRADLDRALADLGPPPAGPGAALSEPAEGELFLVYYPVKDGWAGFAITDHGIGARRLGAVDTEAPAQLSDRLLSPFQREIAAAKRIRFSPYGPLERADFHALPWEGAPLLQHAPIEYGVDVPLPRAEPAIAPPHALLVADPSYNLEGSRIEADAVAPALGQRGFVVDRLQEDGATREAVLGALGRRDVTLFHYSGHGSFTGLDGLESGLPMAKEGWLTLGDIMALPRVPERVVLSGCETGRAAVTSGPAGLGLGQAFIAAGARTVVVATRPVADKLAGSIAGKLYGDGAIGAAIDVAASLRAAQLAAAAGSPGGDWKAFRVLVP
jgi:cellulose synthase operon protein C